MSSMGSERAMASAIQSLRGRMGHEISSEPKSTEAMRRLLLLVTLAESAEWPPEAGSNSKASRNALKRRRIDDFRCSSPAV